MFRPSLASTHPSLAAALTIACFWSHTASAQQGTLHQAVTKALESEPGIAAVQAEQDAAVTTIDLARRAYWPRVDGLLQMNRATRNNVAGLLFPQSVMAPISGPPSALNSASSVWGTAVGALVTWEPFDFGARRGAIDAARHAGDRAAHAVARTRLETAALVADAYLTVLAGEATVRAAQAAVARADTLTTVIDALVRAEIRPGVDLTSIVAERAAAAIQVVQAQRAAAAARALLTRYAGAGVQPMALTLPPFSGGGAGASGSTSQHPAVGEREAAVAESNARVDAARHSADPRIAVQGTVFGRGTGILDDGSLGRGATGLGLAAYNWATGVTLAVPLTEWLHRPSREALERARAREAEARRDQTTRDLAYRIDLAARDVAAAGELARQMPAVVAAARAAHEQATARYQAGLSSITDVADAQRRLAQVEIDAAIVNLSGWRARLTLAALTSASADDFLRELPGTP